MAIFHGIDYGKINLDKEQMHVIYSKHEKMHMMKSERVIESRLAEETDHKLLHVPIGFPIQQVTILGL